MATQPDVLIIGAGLAGLACARHLQEAGVSCDILEAGDAVGGRVRTDEVEGFLLDRGFQVLLTAYPEAQRVLDFPALDLKPFTPGALVWSAGKLHRMVDPWRVPAHWAEAARLPIGKWKDKLRLLRLRRRLTRSSLEKIFGARERSTHEALLAEGFSAPFIHDFFRPLFAGILLDKDLTASSRMYEFVFRALAMGGAALPARGMRAIPEQLAAKLPAGSIHTGVHVEAIHETSVLLAGGELLRPRAVVVATDGPAAADLVGHPPAGSRGLTCFYYAAGKPPITEPMLVLNGDGAGPVNHLCVPNLVAPGYAPPGAALVSANVIGTFELTDAQLGGFIIAHLKQWFGPVVRDWKFLRSYQIAHAQPEQPPGSLEPPARPVRVRPGIYICGDHRDTASIQGALVSGRRAAEALVEDFARQA